MKKVIKQAQNLLFLNSRNPLDPNMITQVHHNTFHKFHEAPIMLEYWPIPENIHTIPRIASTFSPPLTFGISQVHFSPMPLKFYNHQPPFRSEFPFFCQALQDLTSRVCKYAQFGLFYAKIFDMTLLLYFSKAGSEGVILTLEILLE